MNCDHKCHHGLGLNPWIEYCPICGCPNKDFDPTIEAPSTFEEILAYHERQERLATVEASD